jgi:UPF0755 protein
VLLAVSAACGLLAGAALIGLTLADTSTDLGPADPALDPLQRGLLTAYLNLRRAALEAPAGASAERLDVEVLPGQSASAILDQLRELGIARDPVLLRAYLRYRGIDRSIQAGHYLLSGAMTPRQVAEALQRATLPPMVVTIPEGWRLEQIAESLEGSGVSFSSQDFLDSAYSGLVTSPLTADLPVPTQLEGFLFPDTYHLDAQSTAIDLLTSMLQSFDRRVTSDLRSGFAGQGLSLHQAVTLASIVEREAVVADERPMIASVFLNRLAQGMRLDADPTVQYALGRQPDGSWWKVGLTLDDLQIASPYNTYVHTGLPPGPIANPGLESLRAVAAPAETPFLYFRAACDGSGRHVFAETLEEQLQNACP